MTRSQTVQRVLQVHSRYRQAGGEDEVLAAEKRLLEAAGMSVTQVLFDNPGPGSHRASPASLITQGVSAVWSRGAARRVREAIKANDSQVVHVHNTFVAASPSVYEAAYSCRVPVVQTLHNYRLVCPAGTVYRSGHPCTDCIGHTIPWPAVAHACYRGSRAQSAVVAATLAVGRATRTYSRKIGSYLALTQFQRDLLVQGGLPAAKIDVLPNFLEPDPGEGDGPRNGFLFVGRLSEDKGVATLLGAAALAPGLVRVAGDGPLTLLVENASQTGDLESLGQLDKAAVFDRLRGAVAMVLPSVWFEGFPMSVLEAYATGTPVIASGIGSLGEVVEDGVTGLLVRPGDAEDLADRLRWADSHRDEMRRMGSNARREYETRYRGEAHLAALLSTYQRLITAAGHDEGH
ncbi:MAG: glycosyltransferase family 4 protein [Candidatus Limnocylindrales bacterium]|jgi:glycosyltransferase involved in cell wall biosynthesis